MNPTQPQQPSFDSFTRALGVNSQSSQPKAPMWSDKLQSLYSTPTQPTNTQNPNDIRNNPQAVNTDNPLANSLMNNESQAATAGVSKFTSGFNQIREGIDLNNPSFSKVGRGVANEFGGAFETVFSPLTSMFNTITGGKFTDAMSNIQKDLEAGKNKGVLGDITNALSNSPSFQKFSTDNPHAGEVFNNLVTTAMSLAGVKEGPEAIEGALNTAADTTGSLKTSISDTTSNIKEKLSPSEPLDTTVGKVLQGKTKDIASGKSGLSSMDTSNVKTYKDLTKAANDNITQAAKEQDVNLSKDPTPRPLSSFEKVTGTGEGAVKTNYVQQGIDNLKELYTNTSDAEGLSKIKTLEAKANSEGLTVKEVNDLARTYGSEFSSKAFGKTGEALTSVNATKFENIRSGLKDTARDLLPDDASKALDQKMTDLYKVRDLSKKMEEKVNTLEQRLQKPSILQKIGGNFGKALRVTGIGDLFSKLLGIEKVPGAKTLDAVEIQEKLPSLLKKIDEAMKKDDAGFIKDVQDMFQSNTDPITKSTTKTPANQAANVGDNAQSMKKSNNTPIKQTLTQKVKNIKDIPNKQGGFARTPGKISSPEDHVAANVDQLIEKASEGSNLNDVMKNNDTIDYLKEMKDKVLGKGKDSKLSDAEKRLFNITADGLKMPELKMNLKKSSFVQDSKTGRMKGSSKKA